MSEVLDAPADTTTEVAADPKPADAAADPAPADPKPDAAEWRARALTEVFGEAKDDDPPETKAEREKMAKLAGRYTTMGAALKALREAQTKISSGEYKAGLPKNATPEQLAAWRVEHGIPAAPDKYAMPEGVELNEAEKGMVQSVLAAMHEQNAPPAVVQATIKAWKQAQVGLQEQMAEIDAADELAARDALRDRWGGDFAMNMAGMKSMLGQGGSEVMNALTSARGADGKKILSNPAVAEFLASTARELGYVGATVIPASMDQGKSLDDQIAAIEKSMFNENGTKSDAYWKNEATQQRYAQLLEARNRLSK